MVTADRLRELLSYDPDSGIFTRLVTTSSNAKVGDVAGSVSGRGYIEIRIDGKLYKAHRLAWLHQTGEFPPDQIDHVNSVKTDNRWSNLRAATNAENHRNVGKNANNSSGHKGVTRFRGKWRAQIKFNRKRYHLGYFDNIELAALAHAGAARLLFGDFSHATINVTINNYFSGPAQ